MRMYNIISFLIVTSINLADTGEVTNKENSKTLLDKPAFNKTYSLPQFAT